MIASFALWAGDFDYFERLLREFSPSSKTPRLSGKILDADGLVRATGALRMRQYLQKKREFVKMARVYKGRRDQISPRDFGNGNLRATIWRVGVREFVMYAYLTNLDYAGELFSRAHQIAEVEPANNLSARESSDLDLHDVKVFESPGASWTVEGNPFIQAELTDMGLIRATALWTLRSLPGAGDQITGKLYSVLTELDQSTRRNRRMSDSAELNKKGRQ